MALTDIVKSSKIKKDLDSETMKKMIIQDIDKYRDLIAYWRVYPDKLVDYYLSLGNPYNFKFYAYQRLR